MSIPLEPALLGLFNEVGGYGRIDVVDLTNKSHVAGWRPFTNEPYQKDVAPGGQPAARNPQTASWVRFVDNDRVLTVNPAGKLVCWQLPDCVAVYTCEGFGQPLAFSTNRRYLAGSDGSSVHMLDARSGSWVGKLTAPEPPLEILAPDFIQLLVN